MVAIPAFLSSIIGFILPILGVFRRKPKQSASDKKLDDVAAIMNDNYYKRDIVIAGKVIQSAILRESMNAVRDIGHIAWLGGPSVAKFASSYLLEFSRMLLDEDTPVALKMQTLYAVVEVCVCQPESQDKARWNGMLQTLYTLLNSPEECLRNGAVACLVVLINENYENHMIVAKMENMKEKLLFILQDDWLAWRRNEAARLILMLGLNKKNESNEPEYVLQSTQLE